jgi:hypothetical protein
MRAAKGHQTPQEPRRDATAAAPVSAYYRYDLPRSQYVESKSPALSPAQFAACITKLTGQRITADRVTYACRAGNIRATRVGGRWWIPASEIESYVKENDKQKETA